MTTENYPSQRIQARIREFKLPPIRDGLVLGRDSAVGCVAVRKTLELLVNYPFAHIEPDDDIVGDIIVREAMLKRIPEERLTRFVLERIKPLMSADEILQIDFDLEVEVSLKW